MKKQIKTGIAILATLISIGGIYYLKQQEKKATVTILQVEDLEVGKGELAMVGKRIKIHYMASIYQGQSFDSTYGKEPYSVRLGNGETIAGFEQGIPGMRVGGKRRLTMPANMGFGPHGTGEKIPANSALVYEVELLEAKGN